MVCSSFVLSQVLITVVMCRLYFLIFLASVSVSYCIFQWDDPSSVKMKKGAFVVSVSFAIPHKEFVMCEYSEHDMSYGKANVFIQQKATDPHEYVEPVAEDEDRGEGEDEDGEQEHGGGGEGGDAR